MPLSNKIENLPLLSISENASSGFLGSGSPSSSLSLCLFYSAWLARLAKRANMIIPRASCFMRSENYSISSLMISLTSPDVISPTSPGSMIHS